MVPTLVENSNFFVHLFVNCFCKQFIMTGELTHTASKMAPRARVPQLYQLSSEK